MPVDRFADTAMLSFRGLPGSLLMFNVEKVELEDLHRSTVKPRFCLQIWSWHITHDWPIITGNYIRGIVAVLQRTYPCINIP